MLHIQKIKKGASASHRAQFFISIPEIKVIKKPATSYFPRQLPTKYHRR